MKRLIQKLSQFHICLTPEQQRQFQLYYELLSATNQKMNLTAITGWNDTVDKHFVDSLSIAPVKDMTVPMRVLDLGTGAGFPGIPLKIVFPQLTIVLLDSLNKRVRFLRDVIDALHLAGIEALHGRAEDFAKMPGYREQFDLCVSRAVANLSTLSEYCLPFVKPGGQFVAYKSEKASEELAGAGKAISILGGRLASSREFLLPDTDLMRTLLIIDKKKPTPGNYPRKAGLPSREPIH